MTKIFLAGSLAHTYLRGEVSIPFALESYYYIPKNKELDLSIYEDFILDSGGFTFGASKKRTSNDFDTYLEGYIDYVKENKVKNFMELDIDNLIGYQKVDEYRTYMEQRLGLPAIPVWNVWRGMKKYHEYCENYDFISIGRIGKSGLASRPDKIKTLLAIAEQRNTKVHLLGYTPPNLDEFDCYSVDSTSWLSGGQFGVLHYFDGHTLQRVKPPDNKKTVRDYQKVNIHNAKEWVKFARFQDQRYKGVSK